MASNPFTTVEKAYHKFPIDEYVDACVIAYFMANLPPGPMAATDDPIPSAKFLFAGFCKDPDDPSKLLCDETGTPIVVRKWTEWLRISFNKKAKLMQLFKGFDNLKDILQDCQSSTGRLYTTPMQIQLEATDDVYSRIMRVKPGNNHAIIDQIFYDETYTPYKLVKAYGRTVPLEQAACKLKTGVQVYEQPDMVDAPDN